METKNKLFADVSAKDWNDWRWQVRNRIETLDDLKKYIKLTPEEEEGVERGVDFFDCVYPTRNGRHGHVYTNQGKINLFNQKYEKDMRPIEEGCGCPTCRRYSRAYVRHLLKAKEMLGMRLCVLHNLYFYNTMMEEIRDAIDEGRFHSYKEEKLYGMGQINREKEKQNG